MESGGIEGLVAQLQEALPGFTALDRDLVLGDVTVELVGRTGDNRLVLVRRVESVDAEAMTGLLDLLSTARAQAALLARHVGAGVEASAPQVVLVTEEMDERAARRLAPLHLCARHTILHRGRDLMHTFPFCTCAHCT